MEKLIKPGELIILYADEKSEYLVVYDKGKKISTHLGILNLPENLKFGTSIKTHLEKRFWVLPPSTKDLSVKVERLTTIIYPKDAGLMLIETGVGAGSRVIEVGSGSGALTIILAKCVGKDGKVYSFEKNSKFLELARKNVEKAGLSYAVEFFEKDPLKEGFGLEDIDAIFVDVPEPWKFVDKAWESLKPGGFWASLSPNIEQVQKVYRELNGLFTRIKTYEVILRPILIREEKTRPKEWIISHTGYLTFGQKILFFEEL